MVPAPRRTARIQVAGTDLGDVVVLDVDATIVVAHSEKENASPTYTRTFGFHPLGVWCDNTEEFLSGMLRTGRSGSTTAGDHITVLTEAIAQVPGTHRRRLLVRSDGAGASHQLLDWPYRLSGDPVRRLETCGDRRRGRVRRAAVVFERDLVRGRYTFG